LAINSLFNYISIVNNTYSLADAYFSVMIIVCRLAGFLTAKFPADAGHKPILLGARDVLTLDEFSRFDFQENLAAHLTVHDWLLVI
jgi:hypothetical protein